MASQVSNRRKPVLLFDLWRTLAFNDHPFLEREPVWKAHEILHGEHAQRDATFLTWSLTTDFKHPLEYIANAAKTFNIDQTSDCADRFESIVKLESQYTQLYPDVLSSLKRYQSRGYEMGIVSNLWRFPAHRIMNELGIGAFISDEHCAFSYREGLRKPDPLLFVCAVRMMQTAPEMCVMVGDSLESDILPASHLGMHTVFIDRDRKYSPEIVRTVPRAYYIRNLAELDAILEKIGAELDAVYPQSH